MLAVLLDEIGEFGEASRDCQALGIPVEQQVRGAARDNVNWILSVAASYQPSIVVAYESAVACYAAMQLKRVLGVHNVRIGHTDDATEARFTKAFCGIQGDDAFSLVIPVSKTLEAKYAAVAPAHTSICRIPYGAPDPQRKASWSDESFSIVYVGRLIQFQKRIKEVTEAFITACQRTPSLRAVIIGDGPETESVSKAVASSGVAKQISLKGRLHANDVAKEVADCQAIVLLSDFEGIPVAIMEALAMGVVPVLLYSDSGIPELVQHGVNGLLCHDREEDFQSCIKQLSQDRESWEKMSSAARAHYEANYDQHSALHKWHHALANLEVKHIDWVRQPLEAEFPDKQWKYSIGDSSMAKGVAKLPYIVCGIAWAGWRAIPVPCRKLVKKILAGKIDSLNR
jgi:colanic acid/amylovoran biosynthesis glycosyltransferase